MTGHVILKNNKRWIVSLSMTTAPFVALSAKGLKSANRVGRKDFRFISGSDVFVCDRFQAMFISPRIISLIENDSTIDEFILDHADCESFKTLEQLICGETIHADENSMKLLLDLIEDLGNVELSESVINCDEKETELVVSNCNSRLKRKMRLNINIGGEIDFIATHISDFEVNDIRELDISVIENILQQDSLRILNEDWLLRFVFELGPTHYGLIRHVRFDFLNPESIDLFFNTISICMLDDGIWERMRNRMRHRLIYDREELLNPRCTESVHRLPDSPWSGLISYLRGLCFGNVHEKGVINITCSSTEYNHCWDVVNYDWKNYWHTTNSPNNWIQFDFKDWIVSLTHYSLKSDGCSSHHLLAWELCGSMDGNTWVVLDRQETNELNGNYLTKIFSCSAEASCPDFYRYIRLRETGKNSAGSNYLMLANVEFFGSMMKSENTQMASAASSPDS
jgi:hypothetical protein